MDEGWKGVEVLHLNVSSVTSNPPTAIRMKFSATDKKSNNIWCLPFDVKPQQPPLYSVCVVFVNIKAEFRIFQLRFSGILQQGHLIAMYFQREENKGNKNKMMKTYSG